MSEVTREEWIEIDRVIRRFGAANRVSIVVGLVLVPLLFGGIGAGLWAVIPAPFGAWIGGSILGAGAILLCFVLWYRHRTLSRPPFAAHATIQRWILQQGRHGQQAHAVEVTIEGASTIASAGLGEPLPSHVGGPKKLRLTSPSLFEAVPEGHSVMLLCMPTQEVVAIRHGGRLMTA